MKKSQIRVTMVIIILVAALVGFYAYLSVRAKDRTESLEISPVQMVLSRNMTNDYPATPREVMRYYTEIVKCYYNEDCTSEELDDLGLRARELYDADLLEANELGIYLIRLRQDVKDFRDAERRITSAGVASSTNVDFFEDSGYSFARILCIYSIAEGKQSGQQRIVYLLRKDENKRWKIYGWDLEENVHPGEGGADGGSAAEEA